MFLFPSALIMGGDFSIRDYFVWNEIPTVLGNMVGGLAFTGIPLYSTHARTAPSRRAKPIAVPAVASEIQRAEVA
jgi:formate transporter